MIIAGTPVTGTGPQIRGFDPAAGQQLDPVYRYGDADDVQAAAAAAAERDLDFLLGAEDVPVRHNCDRDDVLCFRQSYP